MRSFSDAKEAGPAPRSRWRRWGILLGAVILFLVVFDLLERWVGPGPPRSDLSESGSAEPQGPVRPEITRLGRSGVRIEVEGGHRIAINLDEPDEADRLVACLEKRIAESPDIRPTPDSPASRNAQRRQVWHEVLRLHGDCMSDAVGIPIRGAL